MLSRSVVDMPEGPEDIFESSESVFDSSEELLAELLEDEIIKDIFASTMEVLDKMLEDMLDSSEDEVDRLPVISKGVLVATGLMLDALTDWLTGIDTLDEADR